MKKMSKDYQTHLSKVHTKMRLNKKDKNSAFFRFIKTNALLKLVNSIKKKFVTPLERLNCTHFFLLLPLRICFTKFFSNNVGRRGKKRRGVGLGGRGRGRKMKKWFVKWLILENVFDYVWQAIFSYFSFLALLSFLSLLSSFWQNHSNRLRKKKTRKKGFYFSSVSVKVYRQRQQQHQRRQYQHVDCLLWLKNTVKNPNHHLSVSFLVTQRAKEGKKPQNLGKFVLMDWEQNEHFASFWQAAKKNPTFQIFPKIFFTSTTTFFSSRPFLFLSTRIIIFINSIVST